MHIIIAEHSGSQVAMTADARHDQNVPFDLHGAVFVDVEVSPLVHRCKVRLIDKRAVSWSFTVTPIVRTADLPIGRYR